MYDIFGHRTSFANFIHNKSCTNQLNFVSLIFSPITEKKTLYINKNNNSCLLVKNYLITVLFPFSYISQVLKKLYFDFYIPI